MSNLISFGIHTSFDEFSLSKSSVIQKKQSQAAIDKIPLENRNMVSPTKFPLTNHSTELINNEVLFRNYLEPIPSCQYYCDKPVQSQIEQSLGAINKTSYELQSLDTVSHNDDFPVENPILTSRRFEQLQSNTSISDLECGLFPEANHATIDELTPLEEVNIPTVVPYQAFSEEKYLAIPARKTNRKNKCWLEDLDNGTVTVVSQPFEFGMTIPFVQNRHYAEFKLNRNCELFNNRLSLTDLN